MGATQDSTIIEIWNSFARDKLYDVLQNALHGITSMSRNEDQILIPITERTPDPGLDLQTSMSSTDSVLEAAIKSLDFAQLDCE